MNIKVILPLVLAAFAMQVRAEYPTISQSQNNTGGHSLATNIGYSLKTTARPEDARPPLKLKFTAADGSPVDLSALRGHVVLVDFWATWCPPCMQEAPNVVAAYQKYHAQGFDVIGISLDEDKQRMLSVARSQGMTWPQYFDGQGWDNKLAASFGIRSIPTMWLVNKKGVLVSTDARGNLDSEVPALLAE